ncbi:MAG: PIN domain-containing protein [Bacteroidetes bacterium]|jgi:predicted nucleic-acid-binding protein|nr:PIN domain-containing protein [Bacteroidota bacterium]
MIVLDTNLVLRFLRRDVEAQFQAARDVIARERCLVHRSVLADVVFVLERVYEEPRGRIVEAVRGFLGLPTVELADVAYLHALTSYADGFDFDDAMLMAEADGDCIYTFDQAFVRRAATVEGACVEHPPERADG